MFDVDGSVWLAGIPAKDDIRHLQQALRDSGHSVVFSQSNPGEALS
jgi:anaerobic ribonucleoside-triphosphate reductase activating protein